MKVYESIPKENIKFLIDHSKEIWEEKLKGFNLFEVQVLINMLNNQMVAQMLKKQQEELK